MPENGLANGQPDSGEAIERGEDDMKIKELEGLEDGS